MSIKNYDVVVTDLHHRITGVSTTIRTLLPLLNKRLKLCLVSKQKEPGIQTIGLRDVFAQLRSHKTDKKTTIWHVRRNNEMRWALIAKFIFRANIKIVFTSAAKRRHSAYPRWLISKMDAVIATSDEAASFVQPVIATIQHGVDCNRFRTIEPDTTLLESLGLTGKHHIGIFGRVRAEKGTDIFVASMLRVLPLFPEYKAVIVGKTTRKFRVFRNELELQIDKAGLSNRFIWLDEVPYEYMPQIYNAMSLVTAPARYEGFGMVPLEAMACQVPVVASRTGAYEDMIEPGVNGALVACGDAEGLQISVQAFLESPELLSQRGRAGREIVLSKFSAELEAEAIKSVYQQLWTME